MKSLYALMILCWALCNGLSTAPTWITSQFIISGTTTIVADSIYKNSDRNAAYVSSFNKTFTNIPFTALGIINIQYQSQPTNVLFGFNIQDLNNKSHINIKLKYHSLTPDFKNIRISWLAVDPIQINYLKVDYFSADFSSANGDSVSSNSGDRFKEGFHNLAVSVNASNNISVIPLLVGVNLNTNDNKHELSWITSLANESHVSYKLTVMGSTTITNIVSYILLYDKTEAEKTKELFLDQIYITGTNNIANNFSLIFSDPINFHVGLNSFRIETFGFNFNKSTLSLSSSGNYLSLNLSGWNFRKRICSNTHPYYDDDSNLCYDDCPSGYLNIEAGTGQKYCAICHQIILNCQFCNSTTLCTQCLNPYILNPSQDACQCPDTHFANSGQCTICHQTCKTCNESTQDSCLSCDEKERNLSGSTCSCINGAYLNGTCNTTCTDLGCLECPISNLSSCTTCRSTFNQDNDTCFCPNRTYVNVAEQKCSSCHSNCYKCTGSTENQCSQCLFSENRSLLNTSCPCITNYSENISQNCVEINNDCQIGYVMKGGNCSEVCGDGLKFQVACDDGNSDNGDGCSSICSIQQHYQCENGSSTTASICSYNGTLQFYLKSAFKDIFSNHLDIKYQVDPVLPFMTSLQNLSGIIDFQNSEVIIKKVAFNDGIKMIELSLDYTQNLHLKNLKLSFTPPKLSSTYAIQSSSFNWQVRSTNKLAVLYYEDSVYQSTRIIQVFGIIAIVGCLLIYFGSLLFYKQLGLQLIFLFQFSFLSFSFLEFAQPFLAPISNWRTVFIYNQWDPQPLQADPITSNFRTLGYQRYFGYSYNVMLIILFIIYLVCTVLWIISIINVTSLGTKCRYFSLLLFRQVCFGLVMINLPNLIIGFSIEVSTGSIERSDVIWSTFILVISIITTVAHIIFFILTNNQSMQSSSFYKKYHQLSSYHPLYLILRNILITIFIVLYAQIGSSSFYVIMSLQIIYTCSIIAFRPYKYKIDLLRCLFIEVSLLFIIISRFLQTNIVNLENTQNSIGQFYKISAFIQYTLLIICVIVSLLSLIFHLLKVFKRYNQIQSHSSSISQILQIQPNYIVPNDNNEINNFPKQDKLKLNNSMGLLVPDNQQIINEQLIQNPKNNIQFQSIDPNEIQENSINNNNNKIINMRKKKLSAIDKKNLTNEKQSQESIKKEKKISVVDVNEQEILDDNALDYQTSKRKLKS